MTSTESSIQMAAEVRRRAERFASLRAAQRALSRSVHPSELAQANEQGRELLIQLQALSSQVPGGDEAPLDSEAFQRIDALLDENSRRMHQILDRIEISQLRSTVPPLLQGHPEDVRGLVDVLAEGDLQRDENLRKLDYLVTMLCTEERGGRRVVVREPGDVSLRLREAVRQRLGDPEEEASAAERKLGDAIAQLLRGTADVGQVRDEVRRFKEQMGPQLLHPRVFTAAVAYNVAMSNQVAGLVEGSRSIDRLAEDLLPAAGGAASTQTSAAATPPASSGDLLGSPGFEALMVAFRARVSGGGDTGDDAGRIAAACPLEGLAPMEVEAFDEGEDDLIARLTRAAVVVGQVCTQIERVDAPLRSLGIDPELLATDGVAEVMREMTAVARKRFADSDYDSAFRISEIKTRNLAKLAAGRERSPSRAPGRTVPTTQDAEPAAASWLDSWGLSTRHLWLAALGAAALLLAVTWLPSGNSGSSYSPDDLTRVSPFLETGYRDERAGLPVFVGSLHPTWDYLGTPERREVATRIGRSFEALEVPGVTLFDSRRRHQAEWEDGELVYLAPRPGGS